MSPKGYSLATLTLTSTQNEFDLDSPTLLPRISYEKEMRDALIVIDWIKMNTHISIKPLCNG